MIANNETNTKDCIVYDCIIVGAGAAGLFCAANMEGTGQRLIIEKTARPGQKLLLSGKGMCNITHGGSIKDFLPHYSQFTESSDDVKPSSVTSKIRTCLYKHNNLKLMRLCEDEGVPLVEREDGKVFPASMKAHDILDMLLAKASANRFEIRCNEEVTAIEPASLTVYTRRSLGASDSAGNSDSTGNSDSAGNRDSRSYELRTRKLIIATGGASYPATGSDGTFMKILERDLGIKTTPLKPALTSIYVENYPYKELSGISFEDVEVTCNGNIRRGPMLLTHKGFSGPAILHLSQYVKPGQLLRINYLPNMSIPDVYYKLKNDQPGENRGIANYLAKEFGLPKAFAEKLFAEPMRKLSSLGPKELENVAHLLTDRVHTISGTGGWKDAMVTAGGVSLDEVDTKTMSLQKHPNIKIIGEALNVNGDTGGYNLQFAYSSAAAAL